MIDNRLLDDLARVAGGAASLISTVRRQVQSDLRGKFDGYTDRLDLGSREEIEKLQAQVNHYRLEQEAIKKRLTALEGLLLGKTATANQNKKKPVATSKKKKK